MTEPPRLPPAFDRQRLIQYFFFAVFLLLLWQVVRILMPFYLALLGAALLALLTYPLHAWVARRLWRSPSIAAGISTTGIFTIVVIPVLLFGWISIKETSKIYPVVRDWVQEADFSTPRPVYDYLPPQLAAMGRRAADFARRWNIDPKKIFLDNLDQLSSGMTGLAKALIKNTLFLLFNILILTFTLFFFLRDGPFIIRRAVELVPMAPRNKHAIVHRIQITLSAVIRGVFVVAVVEGILASLGFALLGVPFPVFLGLLTSFLAPIPFFGPASIWIPVSAGLFISGAYTSAIYVFLWGLCVVSVIDNFLRPLLVSADAKLPILLLFFGMIGGLKVYGVTGVVLGPLTIALLLAFINIYRREYRWLIHPTKQG
ncbi:MAG: AI-2E family transporter [Elusimicrobiota bacterium]